MALVEAEENDGGAGASEPSLRSFETLGRVLRDKVAARSRNIETVLRTSLQHADATGCGKITAHGQRPTTQPHSMGDHSMDCPPTRWP